MKTMLVIVGLFEGFNLVNKVAGLIGVIVSLVVTVVVTLYILDILTLGVVRGWIRGDYDD